MRVRHIGHDAAQRGIGVARRAAPLYLISRDVPERNSAVAVWQSHLPVGLGRALPGLFLCITADVA
jgi:hypothetical protein